MMPLGKVRALVAPAVAVGTLLLGSSAVLAQPADVVITIQNLAPQQGTHLTPFWVGLHNGQFNIFNPGEPASVALERLAEDGDTGPITADFTASGHGSMQATVTGPGDPPVFFPGQSSTHSFTVESTAATSRYFSFASMIIPSNDAFIGNDNPMAYPIFDAGGNFMPRTILVLGSQVWDAGTEVNDEIPEHTAFFGQTMPNTGVDENGVVHPHPGFLGSMGNPGTPSILAHPDFVNADFTLPGYQVALITIVPEPALPGVALVAAMALARARRRLSSPTQR